MAKQQENTAILIVHAKMWNDYYSSISSLID